MMLLDKIDYIDGQCNHLGPVGNKGRLEFTLREDGLIHTSAHFNFDKLYPGNYQPVDWNDDGFDSFMDLAEVMSDMTEDGCYDGKKARRVAVEAFSIQPSLTREPTHLNPMKKAASNIEHRLLDTIPFDKIVFEHDYDTVGLLNPSVGTVKRCSDRLFKYDIYVTGGLNDWTETQYVQELKDIVACTGYEGKILCRKFNELPKNVLYYCSFAGCKYDGLLDHISIELSPYVACHKGVEFDFFEKLEQGYKYTYSRGEYFCQDEYKMKLSSSIRYCPDKISDFFKGSKLWGDSVYDGIFGLVVSEGIELFPLEPLKIIKTSYMPVDVYYCSDSPKKDEKGLVYHEANGRKYLVSQDGMRVIDVVESWSYLCRRKFLLRSGMSLSKWSRERQDSSVLAAFDHSSDLVDLVDGDVSCDLYEVTSYDVDLDDNDKSVLNDLSNAGGYEHQLVNLIAKYDDASGEKAEAIRKVCVQAISSIEDKIVKGFNSSREEFSSYITSKYDRSNKTCPVRVVQTSRGSKFIVHKKGGRFVPLLKAAYGVYFGREWYIDFFGDSSRVYKGGGEIYDSVGRSFRVGYNYFDFLGNQSLFEWYNAANRIRYHAWANVLGTQIAIAKHDLCLDEEVN